MNPLISEYKDALHSYMDLADVLEKATLGEGSENPQQLVASILQNRQQMLRIEQMNARVFRLSEKWRQSRGGMAPETRAQIQEYVDAAKEQALRLERLLDRSAQSIRTFHSALARELEQISTGSRYLKTLNPSGQNHPKFIDNSY